MSIEVQEPRRFMLERGDDQSGVSGTGTVATGVEWPDGMCAMRWMDGHRSTGIYDSIADLIVIHGHAGRTKVVFLDAVAWSDVAAVAWDEEHRQIKDGT